MTKKHTTAFEYKIKVPGGPYPGRLINTKFSHLCNGKNDMHRAYYLVRNKEDKKVYAVECKLGEIVEHLNRYYNLSYAEQARLCGVNNSTVHRWRKYETSADMNTKSREIVAVLEQAIARIDEARIIRITTREILNDIYTRALAILGEHAGDNPNEKYCKIAGSWRRGGAGAELEGAVAVSLAMPALVSHGFRIVYYSENAIALQSINAPSAESVMKHSGDQFGVWATAWL